MSALGGCIHKGWQGLVVNLFMISVVGYYTNGTTTLKVKFNVVEHRSSSR